MWYVQSYKCLFPQDLKMRLQHLWIMVDVKLMASKDNSDICYGPSRYYSSNQSLLNYLQIQSSWQCLLSIVLSVSKTEN
jgi:hypothetical protein